MFRSVLPVRAVLALLPAFLLSPLSAAEPTTIDPAFLKDLQAREIGPANMGGRVVDLAVVESRPSTMFVATATGGLWKTVNNGGTWQPVFEREKVISLGDVTVAPSDPNVVWVGTGEANARNSVTWGNGVYRSGDGGKTWKHMGLEATRHIGRIVIHPKNPDVVLVAALGRLWGPNPERGLFRTRDGGKTWEHVLKLDADTGCVELAQDPAEPDTLYAAAYCVRRDGYSGGNPVTQFGEKAGLYRSTDGGTTWKKLAKGLPTNKIGRCGIDIHRKDPKTLYAIVQTEKTDARRLAGPNPRANDDASTGGLFRSDDRGETWKKVNDICPRPFYFSQVRVDPNDPQRVYVLGIALFGTSDGGKTFRTVGRGTHSDHHAMWIDPRDSDHVVLGNDGGLYFSYDRADTWEHVQNLPLAQFYAIGVDMRQPYRVYGGLQDNGSWGGPSATRNPDGITVADWFRVLGADGFYCQVDPTDPDVVYAEGQYGRLSRVNVATGETASIRPQPKRGDPAYRFNWNSPILVSSHAPRALYYGGNHLFRSTDRGKTWETISPDLTHGKPGPSSYSGHTLTVIAESPVKAGLLYVATDDGRLHRTDDGGKTWKDLTGALGLPKPAGWFTRIECSAHDAGTAFVTVDRHRNDDLAPYLFRTTDHGATWKRVGEGLPTEGPVQVVRESSKLPGLLFVGTEFGLFVSFDKGAHCHPLPAGLPTVPVHDLVIHPRERELVIATHGRGIFILDVGFFEQLTAEAVSAPAHLFDPRPVRRAPTHGSHKLTGARVYNARNPTPEANIVYHLGKAAGGPVKLTVLDDKGTEVARPSAKSSAGLHVVTWNLTRSTGQGQRRVVRAVPSGKYVVRLEVGSMRLEKPLIVTSEGAAQAITGSEDPSEEPNENP